MSYLALYRKYRPTTFDGIVGQDHIVRTLTNQIKENRIGHAYLFTGSRGTGKTTCAKIFARAINCEHPINGSPCGVCSACKALSDPSNLDIIEIDAASNNGVNEIRELRENVQFPPVSCKYKVYISDEVHMLTGAAFNALLKTLEEPPKHAIFILATTEVQKIPATILSRCMRFDFRLVSTEKIAKLISEIFIKEHKEFDEEAIIAIAKAGEGSIRDALSIADTAFSYSSGKLTYNDVMEILGATDFQTLYSFLDNLINGNIGNVLQIIDKLLSLGKNVATLIKDINEQLRNIIIIQTCSKPNKILNLPEQNLSLLKCLSNKTNNNRILNILETFSECENNIKYSNHPRIIFEACSIKASKPEINTDLNSLLGRVTSLENKFNNINIKNSFSEIKNNNSIENPAIENDKLGKEEIKKETTLQTEKNSTDISKNINDKNKKLSIENLSDDELKGRLIKNLGNINSELLRNILINVNVKKFEKVIKLIPINDEDRSILIKKENIEKIKVSLSEYDFSDILIDEVDNKKRKDKIEDATEKLKKIFGEDIVIVKK